ncbi:MAG: hypothetical protein AAGB93_16535 [Planctomycetota bacterium]
MASSSGDPSLSTLDLALAMHTERIEARLATLERQNRRLRRVFAGGAAVAAAFLLVGMRSNQAPADASYRIVYASKFAVKDPRTGKVRMTMAHQTQPGGWAGITLWDDDGRARGELKLWEDGKTLLSMTGADRSRKVDLAVDRDGEVELKLDGRSVSMQ